MIDARVKLNQYTNRVLSMVKAKYDLKDKSEALNRFVELYGSNEIELEVKPEYVKKILAVEEAHFKKYGHRATTIKQLRSEIEGN
jgi:hypothetical protein